MELMSDKINTHIKNFMKNVLKRGKGGEKK